MTHIRITTDDLRRHRACSEGLADWHRYVGDVYEAEDYDLDYQLALIRGPLGRWWGWAVSCGLLPSLPMHGADLSGADLRGSDLSRADLCGADLTDADLTDANLTDANLCGASLWGADMTRADLTGSDLEGTTLPYPRHVKE